ncbi:Ig-like domain-containing protein [Cohnella sp. 56]|uniref:Ig-like domain-containing protein n=1 Tax=Cohnella sp. 56 TaxID=3113722 RepID=UPI0030E9F658
MNATGGSGGYGAGIGSPYQQATGTIIINGGTINATGASNGSAGIGGGHLGAGGTVTINGGTVNATGNNGGSGIGGGYQGAGGTVTINGGIVNATGNNGGAGIGGGYGAPGAAVTITGGVVTPSTGNVPSFSAIGPGSTNSTFGSLSNSGTIVIPSGQRLVIPAGITFENSGTIEGTGSLRGAGTIQNTGTISSPVTGVTVSGNAYDLSFNLNGAPGTPPASLHVLASTVQAAGLSLTSPSPAGYEFDGWYTLDGVPFTDTTPIGSITNTSSATLYAHWKASNIVSVASVSDIRVPYGTMQSGIGLPSSVNVSLSNGTSKPAAVTWDGGAPVYDGEKPGTYAFTGTLTAPSGSVNSDGKTASVNVVVELPTVSTVGTLTDIHVPYGTTLGAAGLPDTVNVTLSSGETKSASVSWNGGTPTYDGTKPGTYAFVGTLTAPTGSTNPGGKTASVNVIVALPTVSTVETLTALYVPYGTKLEDAGLPAAVDVTLSSGDTKSASVTWNGGTPTYDETKPGTYAFVGTLTAPTGSTNPGGKTASVNVVVELPTVSTVGALTDIHVPYGTILGEAGLPSTVDVTLSSGDTKSASVTWNGGTPTYDGTKPGTYAFVGTLTAPTGSTNPGGKTASVNVIVALPTVSTVETLTALHVPYGTKLEDAGLPAAVDVTLSSGDTKSASVTWNGGTPTYDETKPGTYAFVGTLTAPTGSTNPGGKTASVNIIVELPTISSVGTLADIHAPYGTKLEDVGMPATVDVTLSSGDTKSALVTWNGGTPTYDETKPGTYAFVGTLTAPTGSTNPGSKTASINIIVELPTVSTVETLTDLHVPYGTKLEDAGLPATVNVTLSSGDIKSATVTWNGGTPAYDGTKPGTYSFVGTLTAPTGSTNPTNKTASINVIVELPTVSTVETLTDLHVPCGTKLEDAGLPATVNVTLSSGDTKSASVTWNGGTPTYDGTKPGTYAFVGTLTVPTGSTNPGGKTASVNIIVELPTVSSVVTLADIHVPYGTKLEDVGMPAAVDVTLSSGDTKSALVTWNGGTPMYDETKPGTYAFVGTLTAPTGSTNPGSKTAGINIIVELPTVSTVETLTDLHVPYGTKLEDAGLPTTVEVTLSSGDTKSASVTWNGGTPAYDGTKPGTYAFIGTLTAPTGSTNPGGKTASVNIIVELPTVSTVETLTDLHVPYGTKLEDAGLPATVNVTLSSGDIKSATVTWNGGTPAYDGTKPGTYAFIGTLTAPTGSTNPTNKTASINVIVELPTLSSVVTLADIHVPYGTKLEDVGMPAAVDVTLSSGDTKSALVTWNGGTPAYDGTKPGTYAFVGTLTTPTGSTNPGGKTASVNIIVELPTVSTVETLTDLHVPYGTKLEDAGLPAAVDVTLSSGDAKSALVTWNGGTPTYDETKPGTYAFVGTLTAPTGSINPDGKTASVNVVVELPTVSTVGTLADIHVPYGTTLGAAELPTTVDVMLSSGDTKSASVTWNGGMPSYDGTKPGMYAFIGTLTTPTGSTNPEDKTASVNVIVALPTVSTVGTLTDLHVPYGTILGDAELPSTVDVTLSSGDTKSASVTWNGGTPTYDGTKPGTYAFVGTLTAPTGSTNPGGKTASVNIIVELPTVSTVGTLTDIDVPYGTTLGAAGLPTTVDVTLSSGDTKSASVTWNGGTPTYDETKPGTYAFVGTLTAPTGSTNPGGKTASVNIIVELPTVSTVETLTDLHVPYGTKLEDAGLPATVNVTLSSGDTKSATVSWNGGTPTYDGTKPGTYAFVGTLTAPTGSTNPTNKTASINVIVELPTVSTVETLTDLHVPYGTKLEDAGLPATVDVTLSSGDTMSASVTWNGGTPAYDGTKPGTYAFVGTVTAPTGSTNPDGKTANVHVLVDFAPTPAPSDPSRIVVNCGIGVCTIGLGDKANVSVPANAIPRPFVLTLEMLDANEPRLPDGALALSKIFRLSKNIEEPLQAQMSLQIRLDSITIGEARRAALFAYDDKANKWIEIDGSLNGDVFAVQTNRFAAFAVLSVAKQTTQPEVPAIQLSDVSGHWAKTEIEAAVSKGILTGYQDGTFRPNQQVSRVEFTVMLNRALKLSGGATESAEPEAFADAASIPAWARSSVAEAAAQGLIQGFADGTFRPGALMSRAELAVIAARALQLPESSEAALSFADANDIPAWAKAAVASAQQAGLMKGKEGNQFAPLASVTRAEAAVLIMRMIELL